VSNGVRLAARIQPLDPILFGDNRSARAGEDHTLSDQDPAPSTLYGALGARIALCLGASVHEWDRARPVLGEHAPDLATHDSERSALEGYALLDPEGRMWFPRPLHFRVEATHGRWFALPLLVPAGETASVPSSLGFERRLVPAVASGEESLPAEVEDDLFVDESLLAEILAGEAGAASPLSSSVRGRDSFFRVEVRAGLGMANALNTAGEGLLFTRPYRRFAQAIDRGDGWRGAGFIAWYRVRDLAASDPASWNGPGFLGGDRRRARIAFEIAPERPLGRVLEAVCAAAPESRGWLAYLLTPAVAPAGPLAFEGRKPVAAAIGKPLHVSGWNARDGGPRPLLTLLPAGSVLFFSWDPGLGAGERGNWISERWLAAIDGGGYGASGFGRLLIGVWK
jgi:CRISPR-associated protein (Cas_Cmr3)